MFSVHPSCPPPLFVLTLSYPVATPNDPDCFPDATFYDIGYADICFIVSLITLLAVLRDGSRLLLLKPFANWKLTRDWRRRSRIVSGFRFDKLNVYIIVASPPHTKPSPSPKYRTPTSRLNQFAACPSQPLRAHSNLSICPHCSRC